MPNARYKIAEDESIFAPPKIPGCYLVRPFSPSSQYTARRADEKSPDTTTDDITACDTADASKKSGSDGWDQRELIFENEITGKGEQGFIWNWQSHNAEHQQYEEGGVPILWDPI